MRQNQSVKQFYDRAVQMLAAPASDRVPESPVYPPHDVPRLLVHFGPTSRLSELRSRLPESCFLLGLHADSEAPADDLAGRTLTAPVGAGLDYADKAALLTAILPEKKVRLIVDETCKEQFPAESEAIQKAIRMAIENATSESRRGLIRLRAACCNLRKMLAGPIVKPETVPAETPVVLCGAGPSLSREVETLKTIKDRVVIAAVGHAVRTLDQAGICPDIVVEGDALAGRNWPKGLRSESLLVATAEVAPEVAARFENILWCAGSSMPFNQLAAAYDLPLFQVALNKTVSVHALDYLVRTGFRKIALIGQDYCFGKDGRMYAEPSRGVGADLLHSLPAADGTSTVSSNDTLKMLWDAFSQYLENVSVVPGLHLTNASDGAVLKHTEVNTLAGWAASQTVGKPSVLYRASAETRDDLMLEQTIAELRNEKGTLDRLLDSCRKLGNELGRYPVRSASLQRRKTDVEAAIDAEANVRAGQRCLSWLNTIFQVSDQIMKETPGLVSHEPDPQKQLEFLRRRYGMVRRFCDDLIESLADGRDPHRFSAFTEENLLAIRRSNPALAEGLRERLDSLSPEFDMHWFNQVLPFVKRRQGDSWADLSAFTSFFTEARDVVAKFVEETGFDPQRDAVTVIAPGNWVYVFELLNRFPQMELAVIDPWPELLAQMIQRGCFLHRLPESACVVNVWADPLYVRCRNGWRSRGLRELRFVSPHVAELPDVVSLRRNLELLP